MPETPQAPVAEPAEQGAADPVHRCTLSVAEERIDALVLRSDDGGCQVMLPLDPAPGEYAVRVSAAGTTDQAAVEWRAEDGDGLRLADRGTVVLEEAGERLRGQMRAESSAGAEVRRAEARFDVAAPEEP